MWNAGKVHAAEPGIAKTQIPVACEAPGTQETFYFYLEENDSVAENAEVNKLCLKNGEKGAFEISYKETGTYHYYVHQEQGKDSKTTYDNTIYSVDVYVATDENGQLFAEPVLYINGQDQKKAELTFVNRTETLVASEKLNGPKTGDQTQMKQTVLLMCSAVLVIIGSLNIRRRERKNAE